MGKSITDPLYGSIALTETESKIVSTPTFQRLHNVRQLGLAFLVFPSAGYSRFSHSIGACRNAAKMLEAIERNSGAKIDDEVKAAYRTAALLHDVGHYPFSHTTEHAVEDFYSNSLIKDSGLTRGGHDSALKHEPVGEQILKSDPHITKIISDSTDINSDFLSAIFRKKTPDPLFGIISSELDCDRMDYLARTAHLGGVPFGVVDTEFIIEKSTLGLSNELVFEEKASKAIDHLLIGRYYDYMQMVYHKTVESLEWSLSQSIRYILEADHTLLSEKSIISAIETGLWCTYDDNWLITKIKEGLDRSQSAAGGEIRSDHFRAVLYRKPAKRVWTWESVTNRRDNNMFAITNKLAHAIRRSICSDMDISQDRMAIFTRNFPFVKVPFNDIKDNDFVEELGRSVKISGKFGQRYLVEDKSLLISNLSNYQNSAINIYYLPRLGEHPSVRGKISERFHKELSTAAS